MNIQLLKSCHFIVFGYEHYNPLGIVRSLGECGIYPIAVILKQKKKITSASKYISTLHIVDSVEDGYKLILEHYGSNKTGKKTFLLTADDTITSFLDMHYNEIKDQFYFYNAGSHGRITHYMQKDRLCDLAQKHGFKVPKTYYVHVGDIPDNLEYPVITKTRDSVKAGWKENVHVCFSEQDLLQAFSKIDQSEIVIQEYIEKKNELCLDGISVNQGKDVFVTMGATYNYILPESYSFTFTLKNFKDPSIQAALKGMMSEIGFEGIFTIEFLIGQNDELYFMEINFRHSAWGYASTCLGMNLVTNWACGMLDNTIAHDIYKTIPDNYSAMVELPDFKNRVLKGRLSIFKWIKELSKCSCLYYANKKDPKPFWSALFSSLLK